MFACEQFEARALPQPPKTAGNSCSNDAWIAWARPRRKRNEDGEIPQMDLFDLTSNDP